mmetsp:Transcript_47425/g.121060  ORF Transcript_47425/g.121060 Transcript_47425/m.121060 type:complete len:223 (+) Transcript_47425:1382-2050(+)
MLQLTEPLDLCDLRKVGVAAAVAALDGRCRRLSRNWDPKGPCGRKVQACESLLHPLCPRLDGRPVFHVHVYTGMQPGSPQLLHAGVNALPAGGEMGVGAVPQGEHGKVQFLQLWGAVQPLHKGARLAGWHSVALRGADHQCHLLVREWIALGVVRHVYHLAPIRGKCQLARHMLGNLLGKPVLSAEHDQQLDISLAKSLPLEGGRAERGGRGAGRGRVHLGS